LFGSLLTFSSKEESSFSARDGDGERDIGSRHVSVDSSLVMITKSETLDSPHFYCHVSVESLLGVEKVPGYTAEKEGRRVPRVYNTRSIISQLTQNCHKPSL
jgi:hypothetical protein